MKVKENCVITYLVRPCLSYMYLPLTYVRFSELRSSQKTFHDVYEFSNEKWGSEKREKNHFFKNST